MGILFLSIISTFLSFLIQFLIQSIVACLCFWTEKASSIERLLFIPTLFLSGLLAPVASFPEYIKSWIYLTPFPYLIDFPANLLSGNETNISGGFSMQILWILLLFPVFKNMVCRNKKIYCHGIMNQRKYSRVYKKFLHTSLASELEYKTNILIDLITAFLSLIGSIFLLSIFFQNNGRIGGWEFEEALIIQGIYTILNGITNTWFNPNLTEIVKYIREGTLDFVLLKPIDSQFFISLKK